MISPPDGTLASILFPYASAAMNRIKEHQTRFVHYTSSVVAVSMIENKSVWMRNALVMNDWREVDYGLSCIEHVKSIRLWDDLKQAVNDCHTNLFSELQDFVDKRSKSLREDTYIACLSEHSPAEDDIGRLSMWRAYGGNNGVALVINQTPLVHLSDKLGANSSPVFYATPNDFAFMLEKVVVSINLNREYISTVDRTAFFRSLYVMYFFAVLSTKHPGFQEEKEWRVIYTPFLRSSHNLLYRRRLIDGMLQPVYEIPLEDNLEKGLDEADVPHLLNRLIIGPTKNPIVPHTAFVELLREAGFADAESRVVNSDIPLRR